MFVGVGVAVFVGVGVGVFVGVGVAVFVGVGVDVFVGVGVGVFVGVGVAVFVGVGVNVFVGVGVDVFVGVGVDVFVGVGVNVFVGVGVNVFVGVGVAVDVIGRRRCRWRLRDIDRNVLVPLVGHVDVYVQGRAAPEGRSVVRRRLHVPEARNRHVCLPVHAHRLARKYGERTTCRERESSVSAGGFARPTLEEVQPTGAKAMAVPAGVQSVEVGARDLARRNRRLRS